MYEKSIKTADSEDVDTEVSFFLVVTTVLFGIEDD